MTTHRSRFWFLRILRWAGGVHSGTIDCLAVYVMSGDFKEHVQILSCSTISIYGFFPYGPLYCKCSKNFWEANAVDRKITQINCEIPSLLLNSLKSSAYTRTDFKLVSAHAVKCLWTDWIYKAANLVSHIPQALLIYLGNKNVQERQWSVMKTVSKFQICLRNGKLVNCLECILNYCATISIVTKIITNLNLFLATKTSFWPS